MKGISVLLPIVLAIASAFLPPIITSAQPPNSLIKGSGTAVYFYSTDGKRYVFPNESMYKTWYPTFKDTITISDADLAYIQIGGNVTIKPGSTLVKITTDPKVYAIARGRVLRWVKTEALAQALYGATWNRRVIDIPDVYFSNYLIGTPIEHAEEFSPELFATATLPGTELFGPGAISVTLPASPVSTPSQPASPPPLVTVVPSRPLFTVSLTSSQATVNQNVSVFAEIKGNAKPIQRMEIKTEAGGAILATCEKSTTCSAIYTVSFAPQIERFYAIAYDEDGPILMPGDQRQTLVVSSTSNDLQLSIAPQQITNGSRASFTSEYTARGFVVKSHKIFGLVPGNPQPYLWKDCGGTSSCSGSTIFYRTTDLFSQLMTDGTTIISPVARLTAQGGDEPRPLLRATPQSSKNIVLIELTPPSGEMIGQTVIVDGTRDTDTPFAMCDGPCSITLLVKKPGAVTAFTWVGGKHETSNTIPLMPD